MDKTTKVANLYIATLKAMTLIHQHSHWTTKGNNFYGDHLLFMRIYESAQENLDLAAEKFMGLLGQECMNYQFQSELLNKVILTYKEFSDKPVQMSLSIEKDFVKLSQAIYKLFETEDKLTLGLDDAIMTIANKREEAIYLLQQSLLD